MLEVEGVQLNLPPFVTELRGHQDQAISELVAGFRDRHVMILDAPTGAGKTVIGEAVRQILREGVRKPQTVDVAVINGLEYHRYPHQRDRCIFCNRSLTTPESLAAGYGSDCAARWGLPARHETQWIEAVRNTLVPGSGIPRCLYVCTTKSLQDQFVHDFSYAKLIKGRANYPTYDEPDRFETLGPRHLDASFCSKASLRVDDLPLCDRCYTDAADDRLHGISIEHEGQRQISHCHSCHPWQACPYEIAKNEAIIGPLSVANTAYFLTEANYVGRFGREETRPGEREKPAAFPLLIIDEADTLESVIMGFVEVSMSKKYLREYGLGIPEKVSKPESWEKWTDEAMGVIGKLGQKASEEVMALQNRNEEVPVTLKRKHEQYDRHFGVVSYAKRALALEPENWVLDGYKEGNVVLKPVRIGSHARNLLWRHSDNFLLMSATTISPHQVADDLGLTENEWGFVSVDSNFPPERRPIHVRSAANMTHKTKDTEWPKMVKAVNEVLDLHPQERVLIHTVSYAWTQYLEKALQATEHGYRTLTYSDSRERESVLETYKNRPNAVLLAPSFDRGIDLPDELCRAIIITKVPFPNLSDKQVSQRFHGTGQSGKNWYYTQTIRSIVQMTGRGMRHKGDHVTSYILDAQFSSNLYATPVSRNRLPAWWASALRWAAPTRSK